MGAPPEILRPPPAAAPVPDAPAPPFGRWARFRAWLGHTGPEYRVGTLTYTRLTLFLMFVWLLWGDLVWTLMEMVFPASMPLQLDRLGVPKEWIGYMMGTAGAVINMSFVPVISFRSDRTRTRWGRRIPYIVATMPLLCIFLAVLGFSDSVGAAIHTSNWPARLGLSPVVLICIVMGVLIVLYDVFNVFVNSVYWYLFRDVIPTAFLGRFMAAFRMVGTIATMIWGAFIYGHIETRTPHIYVAAAILYFLGFGLMCLMVKEGKYPPPADYDRSEPWLKKVWHSIHTYARECFSHPLFIAFYIGQAMLFVGGVSVMYKQFFYLRHLHFTTAGLGKVTAILSPIILAIQFPLGWLVDRIHPMRGYLIATTAVIPLLFAGYFIDTYSLAGYTIHAFTLYIAMTSLQMPLLELRSASEVPLMMRLFPLKQYGQFSSANAMLRHFMMIFGTAAAATLMGWTNRRYGQFGNAYAFLWQGVFQTLGVICLWIVYSYWRRNGGEKFRFDPEESAGAK
jgi:MFS family permease